MARPTGVVSLADSIPPPPATGGTVLIKAENSAETAADNAPFTGAKVGLTETQLEQGVRNEPAPAPEVAPRTDVPGVADAEVAQVQVEVLQFKFLHYCLQQYILSLIARFVIFIEV